MAIKTNLVVSLDENAVGGELAVIHFKTTDAGGIIIDCSTPKVSIKLEDLEEAIKELRLFVTDKKHINVVPNANTLVFEYDNTADA